jgi:signal transduction histidine kinase
VTAASRPAFLNLNAAWPLRRTGWGKILALNLGIAVIYTAVGVGLLKLAFVGETVVVFWPPAGMVFAAMWLYGPRVAPGIFLGSLGVNLIILGVWPTSLLVAFDNMLAPMISTLILRRLLRRWDSPRELWRVLAFVLVAVVFAASLSASLGSFSLIVINHDKAAVFPMWWSWVMGDGIGVLMTAPVLILWGRGSGPGGARRPILEPLLFALAAAVIMVGFTFIRNATWSVELYKLFTFVIILSAAARYGMIGAAVGAFFAAVGTVGVSLLTFGPYVRSTMFESFALFYSSLVLQAIAGLLLAAALADLRTTALAEKEAREAAEIASANRIRLLAAISHDVRTPLAGIMGVLQTLQRTPDGEPRPDLVGLALRAGTTLSKIVSDILEAARLEAGRVTVEPAPFDAGRSLADIVALSRGKAAAKGLDLRLVGLDALPPRVQGDRVRFEQIFGNLADNAIAYTEVGGVRVEVRQGGDGPLVIEVVDTGPGLEPDQVAAMLTSSMMTQQAGRRASGLGIGLQISDRLARLMGGTVDYRPAEGGGSHFRVTLPLPALAAAAPATAAAHDGAAQRILLVEDDEISRVVTRELLRSHGHEVQAAATIEDAVGLAIDHRFDLVLTDVSLGASDTGGLEVARRIRRLPFPGGATPIITLTAEGRPEIHGSYRAAGISGVIVKPLTLSTNLAAALREAWW